MTNFSVGINTSLKIGDSTLTFGSIDCKNIVVDSTGKLRPMPFDTGKSGLWYFDGQFYYQKRSSND